jgi:hypothetical protein
MSDLCKDNLYEIRKYLDNVSFLNSLLVCKAWSNYYYKEKRRMVTDKIKPNVLNRGFRHKMLSFTKYRLPDWSISVSGYGTPYYGLCIYKGMKCAFYCPSSFKEIISIQINHPAEFWGPYEKLLPEGFSLECSDDFYMNYPNLPPDYEHFLTARINSKDYLIHKHKYSNTFHVIEAHACYVMVYETPDAILEKLEQSIEYDLFSDLKVLDVVHFEECRLTDTQFLWTIFTYLD